MSSTEPWLMAPYAVLPLGFAANTLLYAVLVLLLTKVIRFGVGALLHSRRLARGLCPRCKYEIRGLDACPECGAAIRRKDE